MIESYTLVRPYAKAIFATALAHNDLAGWSDFLQTSVKIVAEFKRSYVVLNFGLSRKQRLEILASIENKLAYTQQENLLRLLIRRKKLRFLPEITFLYEQLRAEHEGRLEVKVRTAVALTADHKNKLENALYHKFKRNIIFNLVVNPALIGGAIIYVGDLVIDGSVVGMLNRFKRLFGKLNYGT